ncbi:MAG TPA: endonuclease III, partial [Polyangiaceae bacterium]
MTAKKRAAGASRAKGPGARPGITPEAARTTLARLEAIHPDAHCELVHNGPFELLVATVLSAQTTDVAVNKATPGLFARYPDAKSLAL